MSALRPGVHSALAPAKINLGLFVGPVREQDRRHALATVMQSISLADELTLEAAPAGIEHDEVVCPGVDGENLAGQALALFREATAWGAPPLRLKIAKRIPVAAGLGGGSADAAAALRLAAHASGLGDRALLLDLAARLGADVPAQVSPGRWLASGAGERLERLAEPRDPFGVLVLALPAALSTAAVYTRRDTLGSARSVGELHARLAQLRAALAGGEPLPADTQLLRNDLQDAAVALCPPIASALAEARTAGADLALVSGSGPTVLGLFSHTDAAPAAVARLAREPPPVWATPVGGAFARALTRERRVRA
jgi:4-diphosphocytidyl-2-C-methyl-D-erythritol kinase